MNDDIFSEIADQLRPDPKVRARLFEALDAEPAAPPPAPRPRRRLAWVAVAAAVAMVGLAVVPTLIPSDRDLSDPPVPLAPASSRLSDAALESIAIPMLIVTGTDDETTPIDDQSTRPLELASGPATLVEIDGGTHASQRELLDDPRHRRAHARVGAGLAHSGLRAARVVATSASTAGARNRSARAAAT